MKILSTHGAESPNDGTKSFVKQQLSSYDFASKLAPSRQIYIEICELTNKFSFLDHKDSQGHYQLVSLNFDPGGITELYNQDLNKK